MKTYKVTVESNGTICWYNEEGQLHREDGPAHEDVEGTKFWLINSQLHRTDGPAVEDDEGYKAWYLNGQLHRKDGPAVERADGSKEWLVNGQLHRKDGPAIEWASGYKEWYLNGQKLTEREFNRLTQPAKELTVAQLEELLGYKVKIVKG